MVFNKDYSNAYDSLYQDKNYGKECDFLEFLFRKHSVSPRTILDLGCGTGGHAVILAERGYSVAGVDRSAAMLAIARKKALKAGVGADFIKSDITGLALKKRYDAVISMFAVMGYQTGNSELAAACAVAKKHLSPGGVFIFDCWHGPAVLMDRPAPKVKKTEKDGVRIVRHTVPRLDVFRHVADINFKVTATAGGVSTRTAEAHRMRFFFPQEIKYFLETAGFKKVYFYPFLEKGRGLAETDWNMMLVAK